MAHDVRDVRAPGEGWPQRAVAVVAVVVLTAVNLRGITRTARVARVLLAGALGALALVVAVIVFSGQADAGGLALGDAPHGVYGVLQSAGLLFFAFAGYARIATLGEEVREPDAHHPARDHPGTRPGGDHLRRRWALRCWPRSAPRRSAGRPRRWPRPSSRSVRPGRSPWSASGRRSPASARMLALVAGIGRTGLAMAREGDLPRVARQRCILCIASRT